MAAVLWCGGLGFDESRGSIRRDSMPVMCVFEDPASSGDLYPDAPERSVFQLVMPERMAIVVLCRYIRQDRGYQRVALLYDSTVSEGAKAYYREAVQHEGLTDVGIESFNVFATEFGPQLQRLKNDRPEALIVWGLASNTAGVVKQLDQLGAGFVDTPLSDLKRSVSLRGQVPASF